MQVWWNARKTGVLAAHMREAWIAQNQVRCSRIREGGTPAHPGEQMQFLGGIEAALPSEMRAGRPRSQGETLTNNCRDWLCGYHAYQFLIQAIIEIAKLVGIEAHLVQNGRVYVLYVVLVDGCFHP